MRPFLIYIFLLLISLAFNTKITKGTGSVVFFISEEFFQGNFTPDNENQITSPDDAISLKDPAQRLEYLLEKAWRMRNSQPDHSLLLGHEAIELADSLQDAFNLAKAHSFTGVAYRLLGDYNKAIDYFFRGLAIAKDNAIPEQEGYAHINIANLYIYLEYFTQALDNLNLAQEISKEIGNDDMLAYIFLYKGRVLMSINALDDAIENINNSLQLRKKTGNLPGQAVSYKYLADIYYNKADYDLARQNYDLALTSFNEDEDKHLYGNIMLQKARIFCNKKDHVNAAPLALLALKTGREVNSRLLIHDALKVLSKVDLNFGNYRDAAQKLNEMILYADTLFNQQLSEKVLSMEFELERQKQQAQIDIINRDNEIQALKLSRQRFLNTGLIVFALLLVITGSILLVLLRKLKNKNRQLSMQKEELKQINTAKDRMFLVIGHDLRGPVWNLRALIELIREDIDSNDTAAMNENFYALSRAVQSVSDLLENLLYWAKSQDGKMLFNPAPTDMNQLVSKSILPYKPWAEVKNITINYQQNNGELMVHADANMIQTVIRNLLSNAIKYSFRDSSIDIALDRHNNSCRFTITDKGVGLEPDELKRMAENEKIKQQKGTGNETGSGIGLSLCRDFINRHNEELKVESEKGAGTRFSFNLPLLNPTE